LNTSQPEFIFIIIENLSFERKFREFSYYFEAYL